MAKNAYASTSGNPFIAEVICVGTSYYLHFLNVHQHSGFDSAKKSDDIAKITFTEVATILEQLLQCADCNFSADCAQCNTLHKTVCQV